MKTKNKRRYNRHLVIGYVWRTEQQRLNRLDEFRLSLGLSKTQALEQCIDFALENAERLSQWIKGGNKMRPYTSTVDYALQNIGVPVQVFHPMFPTMMCVVANADGTISVCDNGEEVVCKTASSAEEVIEDIILDYEERLSND